MTRKVVSPIALDKSINTTEQTPRNIADVLAQQLAAIKTAIESGNGNLEAAFVCYYGVTTATQINQAIEAGKVPYFYFNGVVAQLWKVETNKYTFRTTNTRSVEGQTILDLVDYIVNGSVWSTVTREVSGGSYSGQSYITSVNSLADFDTTGKSGMQDLVSVANVPADGVYQVSVMLHITPKTASATKSDLVLQFTSSDNTGWPSHTFHAVVDDSQTFAQQLSFSTSVSLKAGENTLRIQCGDLNTEYLVFVDELTVAQLVNGVYHNGDDFADVHTLTEAADFNNDDGVLVDGATGGPRFMLWRTLANKVLGFIHSLIGTATESDLISTNYTILDGSAGPKKLPANTIPACKLIDRGNATVATLNALTFKQDGWKYFVTDTGTLTAGSLSVIAGDFVAWDAATSAWYHIKNVPDEGVSFLVNYTGARRDVLSVTKGKFISYGQFYNNSAYGYTDPVEVKDGEYVTIDCKAANVSMAVMSKYESGTYTNLVVSSDPTYKTYTWHNTTGASVNVVFSFQLDNAPFYCYAYDEKIQDHFSKLDSAIEDNESEISYTENIFGIGKKQNSLVLTSGTFIGHGGTINSNPDYGISSPISLKPFEKISVECTGYSNVIEIISKYDSGTYSNLVRSIDSTKRIYEYVNNTSGEIQVVISCEYASAPSVYITRMYIDRCALDILEQYKAYNPPVKSGYFLTKDGYELNNASFVYSTEAIPVPSGYAIEITTNGINNNVAIFSEKRPTYSTRYKSLVLGIDNTVRKYTYVNNTIVTKYIYVSANGTSIYPTYVYKICVPEFEEKVLTSFSSFTSFGTVGDSFAAGELHKSNGDLTLHPEYSWSAVLSRMTGVPFTLYAQSGSTTKSAFTNANQIPALIADSQKDLYFLCFGINDWYRENYLGSESDMNTSDYTQSADTFYGNYYKMIKTIQNHSPRALVVMIKPYVFAQVDHAAYNEAADKIADTAGIPCLDDFALNDVYAFAMMVTNHPTIIGYSCMATHHKNIIEKWMQTNTCNKLFDDTI